MLENGCKKFHGHYSAANFSTHEFEPHAKKSITAQRIVGHSETAGDEAGHGRNVAADSRITKGHEAEADARGDQAKHVDHGPNLLAEDRRIRVRRLVVLTVLTLVG